MSTVVEMLQVGPSSKEQRTFPLDVSQIFSSVKKTWYLSYGLENLTLRRFTPVGKKSLFPVSITGYVFF